MQSWGGTAVDENQIYPVDAPFFSEMVESRAFLVYQASERILGIGACMAKGSKAGTTYDLAICLIGVLVFWCARYD